MFIVKRCVPDYDDTWKTEIARFPTEKEAIEYADNEETHNSWPPNEWYEVEEEK
jgi:hypothetical protein